MEQVITTHKRPRRRIYKSDKVDNRIKQLRKELGLNARIEQLNYKIKTDLKWVGLCMTNPHLNHLINH